MISENYSIHKSEFIKTADAYIKAGATCVQLKNGDCLLESFPADVVPSGPSFVVESGLELSLWVFGIKDDFPKTMIESSFDLFSRLIQEESELDRLTAALVETQDRLVAIYDLGKSIRRIIDIPNLLTLLVSEVYSLLTITGTFAVMVKNQQPAVILQNGELTLSEDFINQLTLQFQNNPLKNDFRVEGKTNVPVQYGLNIQIPVSNDVFSFIGFYSPEVGFTSPDIKLVTALAEQVGAQMENALMIQDSIVRTSLETELALARQVQMALLPQVLPAVTGVDLYAVSTPAQEVGGDFFDFIMTAGHPLTFVLGDVTGKGMSAALLMAMTRTVARSAARNMPFSAAHQLVNRLNVDLLQDYSSVGMFCTGFVGILDQLSQMLNYCNAGQSPVLYFPRSGEPFLLEAQDIPIGIFDGYEYASQSLQLFPGDVFIVASDGFPEAFNDREEMFGYTRMKNILRASTHLSAREMADALFAAVSDFKGNQPQSDDRTIIIIKIREIDSTTLTIHSTYQEIRYADEKLRSILSSAGLSETFINTCELALHELLTNLVDHAYERNPMGQIQVRLSLESSSIVMETRDSGKTPRINLSEVSMPDPLDLAEGGYGLAIISSLMDELQYYPENGQNIWQLTKFRE